jgi:ketosteroid isomerase-like protein
MASFDPFPELTVVLKDALGAQLDQSASTFIEMMSEDVVLEFPYAADPAFSTISGRDRVTDYLRGVSSLFAVDRIDVQHVHHSQGGGPVVIEMKALGHGRSSGVTYDQHYITVIDVANGQIASYREYFNPERFQVVTEAEAQRRDA